MHISEQNFDIVQAIPYWTMLDIVEHAYRICYASDPKGNAEKFIQSKIALGHHTPLEHCVITVEFDTNRGVTHELVRHRLAAMSQQSSRYCNFAKEKFGSSIEFINNSAFDTEDSFHIDKLPPIFDKSLFPKDSTGKAYITKKDLWHLSCSLDEWFYMTFINDAGMKAEQARDILPNALSTNIMFTCNLREWRHVCNLRALGTTGKPHYQMVELMMPLLNCFNTRYPAFFSDLLIDSETP